MSISLNNHESRIKTLENKVSSGGLSVSGTEANRLLAFDNGLKIHLGFLNASSNYTKINFIKAYTYLPAVLSQTYGVTTGQFSFDNTVKDLSVTGFNIRERSATGGEYRQLWLAIGYLVTNRVLGWVM